MTPSPSRVHRTGPPGIVVAGVDPGITTPAINVVRRKPDGGFESLFHKVYRSDSAISDRARFVRLFDELGRVIREHHVSHVVSEEQRTTQGAKQTKEEDGEIQFNANNSKTIVTVGIILCAARAYGATWSEVRTASARSRVMGASAPKGTKKEKKAQVKAYVEKILGEPFPMDAAEAGLFALYGFVMPPYERGWL